MADYAALRGRWLTWQLPLPMHMQCHCPLRSRELTAACACVRSCSRAWRAGASMFAAGIMLLFAPEGCCCALMEPPALQRHLQTAFERPWADTVSS